MAPMKEAPPNNTKVFLESINHKLRYLIRNTGATFKTVFKKSLFKNDRRMPEATTIHRIPQSQNNQQQIRWLFEVTAGIDCGRQYIGITKVIKVGRALENHIQLRDTKVSRFHAVIRQQGSMLTIKDLNSTNGTWVNERAVQTQKQLFPGDLIQLGETVIRVESALPVENRP
ncbi:MAG TPA: FHA domain-containing protein [Bacillota bacterium]|nr:FHA domain-containing protein [Bacillota bacterium]